MNDAQHLGPVYRTAYAIWWATQQIARIEREAFERMYYRDKNKEQPMTEEKKATTDGLPPDPEMEGRGAPKPIDPETGQHGAYYILPEEERAKGFVRPFRQTYVHKGIRPKHTLRDLTEEEKVRHAGADYISFEPYPEHEPSTGRFWTQAQLISGCGVETRMGTALAETYARAPEFYGSTFCCRCKAHFPVEEFTWSGTEELVGS